MDLREAQSNHTCNICDEQIDKGDIYGYGSTFYIDDLEGGANVDVYKCHVQCGADEHDIHVYAPSITDILSWFSRKGAYVQTYNTVETIDVGLSVDREYHVERARIEWRSYENMFVWGGEIDYNQVRANMIAWCSQIIEKEESLPVSWTRYMSLRSEYDE